MDNKPAYQQFLQQHDLPIFFQDWWLDAVCKNGSWDVALAYKKDGQICGVLPYHLTKMKGRQVIVPPMLTPQTGIWIIYPPTINHTKRFTYEKRIIEELLQQLPSVTYYVQNFSPLFRNGQPLYWLGYQNHLRYSYRLNDLHDLDSVQQKFAGRLRRTLRKAAEKVSIKVSTDLRALYTVNQKTFERQNLPVPYSFDFLKRIDAATKSRQQRTIYLATDDAGELHAGLYIVWDNDTTYNLVAGGDPNFRQSGAMQLLLWRAIQDAATRDHIFDFEGSMLENVAFSFQSYGAELTPYLRFYKPKNRFWATLWTLLGKA